MIKDKASEAFANLLALVRAAELSEVAVDFGWSEGGQPEYCGRGFTLIDMENGFFEITPDESGEPEILPPEAARTRLRDLDARAKDLDLLEDRRVDYDEYDE